MPRNAHLTPRNAHFDYLKNHHTLRACLESRFLLGNTPDIFLERNQKPRDHILPRVETRHLGKIRKPILLE